MVVGENDAAAGTATCQVRVGVRIRPLTSKETSEGGRSVVTANSYDKTVTLSKRQFTYDAVFGPQVSQSALYNDIAPSLLDAFLTGYNSTIIAYGQTGSGKTYTCGSEAHGGIGGSIGDDDEGSSAGLIPRFMSDIFATLIKRSKDVDYEVTASFLEVYGEDIHDLLSSDDESLSQQQKSLPIREDSNKVTFVPGLRTVPITNHKEAMDILDMGTMNRTTAATLMNQTSSRSHAIFTVDLRQTTRCSSSSSSSTANDNDEVEGMTTMSRFTFVDLAGSERMKKTGAEGERAREGIDINIGLFALGKVINALADDGRLGRGEAMIHVPYRQTKLTRLLKDALGGNSQTLFMACVSPSDTNANETLSTLRYANSARNIKNKPKRNVDATALELQRLRTLTSLLQCELIKYKFVDMKEEAGPEDDIGAVNEELFQRDDVLAYMAQINEKLIELSGGNSTSSNPNMVLPARLSSVAQVLDLTGSSPTKHDNDDDGGLILDFNPEEDMQIIDQLLELQQQDQKYQEGQRHDQDRLEDMEGEIEAQENRLLQLREHLKVYHSMKEKYEQLMGEVQSLEAEKRALAELLEKAQADPTRGCSQAIKAKLQKVEVGLASARSETRKTQQLYRQAEQDAQKCKVLERQILELKQAKINLIKKQRQDSAKHKEFTQQKTSEIHALKRKEKNADKKISKMEGEVQKYKTNLNKSKSQYDKLSDKLKQTEVHLMRLLNKRRNDISRSTKVGRQPMMVEFAPMDEEIIKSIKFLLEKTISDRVTLAQNKHTHESKVVERGKLMTAMAKEAKRLHEFKKEYQSMNSSDSGSEGIVGNIRECEDRVQDLQLRIEFLDNDMEELKSKCPHMEDHLFEEVLDDNSPALKLIAKLDGPVLRSLLWNLMESYSTAELQRRALVERLDRKTSTLKSLENEMQLQNEKISSLTMNLNRRRKSATSDGDLDTTNQNLRKEVQIVSAKLDSCHAEMVKLSAELEDSRREKSEATERLALLHSERKLTESTKKTEFMLSQLQEIITAIGMTMDHREEIRQRLENCVEDACSKMLGEVKTIRDEKIDKISYQEYQLHEICAALGLEHPASGMGGPSLTSQLNSLDQQLNEINPQYRAAIERSLRLKTDAKSLVDDLSIGDELSSNLQMLLNNHRCTPTKKRASFITDQQRMSMETSREARAKMLKNVEQMMKNMPNEKSSLKDKDDRNNHHTDGSQERSEYGNLSTLFLDECEEDIKHLRLQKSERLISNSESCERINVITKQMHVGSNGLSSIVNHALKRRNRVLLWWDESVAKTVYDALSKKSHILVDGAFVKHLNVIFDTIHGVSKGRQLLSDSLSKVIHEGHAAVLATAKGCGMNVDDLAQSLHEALLNLPPLSNEYVKACLDEMQMLVAAADTISQSEVETLTVLWEGLNRTSSDRGRFWEELDRELNQIEMSTASPFDNVLKDCSLDVEEWVLKLSKDAIKVNRMLSVKVFKLNRIHQEVEKLKLTQEAKNGIMSLNSELKLLSAKLIDFEERAGDKQRLLNKKGNGTSLLEEERFRKQMQTLFVTKLESLRQMLNRWESKEGIIEDDDLLSEVVKSMLQNSHRSDAWINDKTRFMHLRTTANTNLRPTLESDRANTRPLSGPGRVVRDRRIGAPSSHSLKRSSSPSSLKNSRQASQTSTTRPARSTFAGQQSMPPKTLPPPRLNRTALSSSNHNASELKNLTKTTHSDKTDQVLLPFGNLADENGTQL